jgi:hypothetical protein
MAEYAASLFSTRSAILAFNFRRFYSTTFTPLLKHQKLLRRRRVMRFRRPPLSLLVQFYTFYAARSHSVMELGFSVWKKDLK